MIKWTRLDRGVLRYQRDGLIADVWAMEGGIRWTVYDDALGEYVAYGVEEDKNNACKAAVTAMREREVPK